MLRGGLRSGLRNGLSLWRRLVPPGTSRAIRSNLAVLGVFVVMALFFLTRTLFASAGIDRDLESAVDPELAAIGTDTVHLPVLDRTASLAQRIAEAARPLHDDLAATGSSTADIDVTTRTIIGDVTSTGASIHGIDVSVTAIRAAAERLVPVVLAIRADTGDITAHLTSTAALTDRVEASVADIVARLGETAAAVGRIAGPVHQVEASLRAVGDHTENIENSAVLRLTNLRSPAGAARPATK